MLRAGLTLLLVAVALLCLALPTDASIKVVAKTDLLVSTDWPRFISRLHDSASRISVRVLNRSPWVQSGRNVALCATTLTMFFIESNATTGSMSTLGRCSIPFTYQSEVRCPC